MKYIIFVIIFSEFICERGIIKQIKKVAGKGKERKELSLTYSDDHKVLSGVYWRIMSFKKKSNGRYNSQLYTISDFATIK